MLKLPPDIDGQQLLNYLSKSRRIEVDGWAISKDLIDVWLTNPYGLDVGFYPISTAGCESILQCIRNNTNEREWGTL